MPNSKMRVLKVSITHFYSFMVYFPQLNVEMFDDVFIKGYKKNLLSKCTMQCRLHEKGMV